MRNWIYTVGHFQDCWVDSVHIMKNVEWIDSFNYHSAWKSKLRFLASLPTSFILFMLWFDFFCKRRLLSQVWTSTWTILQRQDWKRQTTQFGILTFLESPSAQIPRWFDKLISTKFRCHSWQRASSGWRWQIQVSRGQNCWRLQMPRWPWKLR